MKFYKIIQMTSLVPFPAGLVVGTNDANLFVFQDSDGSIKSVDPSDYADVFLDVTGDTVSTPIMEVVADEPIVTEAINNVEANASEAAVDKGEEV